MADNEAERPGQELREVRLQKWRALAQAGQDPFLQTRYPRSHAAEEIRTAYPDNAGERVHVAGRVTAVRGHGGAAFLDVRDQSGRVQVFVRAEETAAFAALEHLDIGDLIGVAGTVFATKRGEVSIEASAITMLAKSLRGLPDKWRGLQDVDLRYRQRYLDLLANPAVRDVFRLRSETLRLIRAFLHEEGFLEVETPILSPLAGGGEARPFQTHHNTFDTTLFLRIAMELYLKRLIVGGFERVFEIGKAFRNEGTDARHSPEFTMLELYWAYVGYEDIMALVERLFTYVLQSVRGSLVITAAGTPLDFSPPYPRVDMLTRIEERTGLNWRLVNSRDDARRAAERLGIKVDPTASWGQILDKVVAQVVEPDLIQPTFLIHHPVELSPLAKRRVEDPRTTERFELFCLGRELANAYSELNDPVDQRARFLNQAAEREAGNDEAPPVDEDYLLALEHGMPPTGGLGVGIDRLLMLMADVPSIRDVILFPTMRPIS